MTGGLAGDLAARRWQSAAGRLIDWQGERWGTSQQMLCDDPWSAVTKAGVTVVPSDDSLAGRDCQLLGYYDSRNSTISLTSSGNDGRDWFTLLHEYGHHVQASCPEWVNALASYQPKNHRKKAKESVADSFAAQALLPRDLFTFESEVPRAVEILALAAETRASHWALIRRVTDLASREARYAVALVDSTGKVLFTATTSEDLPHPARNSVQPDLAGLFARASDSDMRQIKASMSDGVVALSGWTQDNLQADLALDDAGGLGVAVITRQHRFGPARWSKSRAECSNPACEKTFEVTSTTVRCGVCQEWKCPACGECACVLDETPDTCPKCFLTYSTEEREHRERHEC
ncbi:MAG: ImmA/IrrE family metallo-endopeptidase [Bifidobacteriaceae bacterium]|jgi:Zn-dependent peptidase ImmA (M78 family)|nr:ImmA/IrrE family metallo-endopeptidase [Bifidobacteriaceae bacterium]